MLSTSTRHGIDVPDLSLPDLSLPDLSLPDATELLRRADVPGRVDAAVGAASDAARTVIEQLPGQRRRRRPVLLGAGVLVGAVAVTGLAAWWLRRSAARRTARELLVEELEFDREARDRATAEGMTGTPVVDEVRLGQDAGARNGSAVAEPV